MAQDKVPLTMEVAGEQEIKSNTGSKQRLASLEGPLITLLVIALLVFLSAIQLTVLNPADVLLVAVAYSAFRRGVTSGLWSALLTILYYFVFYSQPGQLFHYTLDHLSRLSVAIVVSPLMAILVGTLKQRSDGAARKLLEQARFHETHTRTLNTELEQRVRERTAQLDTIMRAEHEARLQAEANAKRLAAVLAERQQLEEALRQSDLRVRLRANEMETAFESMTDGVNVYDRDGRILYTNTAYAHLIGLEAAPKHVQMTPEERGNQLILHDEEGNPLTNEQRPVARMLAGEVFTGADTVEMVMQTLDGREREVSVTGAPIRDQENNVTGGVLIFRDVTERRQLARRTQASLEALLAMAEELVQFSGERDAISPPDLAQRLAELIRNVLACRRVSLTTIEPGTGELRSMAVVGLSPELEKLWRERRPGYRLHDQLHNVGAAERIEANEVVIFDYTQPPLRDMPNPFGIRTMLFAPMKIGKQIVGILTLDFGENQHDYTENELGLARAVAKLAALVIERERLLQERAQAHADELALREANRRMDEFLGIASHEIRTPLTSIKANIQLAQRQMKRLKEQRNSPIADELAGYIQTMQDMLDRAIRQVGVQNRLVSDLLDVSRIYAGKLELRLAPCDVVMIVQRAVEDQRYIVEPRQIHVDIQMTSAPVVADADRVEQVVNNYLSNALKYSESRYAVDVRVEQRNNAVYVSVQDKGPGLTKEQQEHIWERFYRAEGIQVKSGSGVGLGLGLHICRTIIERQGGQVGVESIPCEGSTFWFTLPLTS